MRPQRLIDVFAGIDRFQLVVAIVAVGPAFCATTLRWCLLLRPAGRVPVVRAGRLLSVAYLLNLIFPARPGDLLRAYSIGRPSGPSFSTALTTIVVEKALDGAAVVVLIAALLSRLAPMPWLRHGVVVAALAFAALLLAIVLLAAHGDRSIPAIRVLFRRHPALATRATIGMERVRSGTRSFTSPALLAAILGLTLAVWAASLVTTYSLAAAFALHVPLGLPALALGAATLGLVVPAAPGGIGAYQVLVMAVLTPAGVPAATALGYGLALQFCQILPLAVLGAVGTAGAPRVRPTPSTAEKVQVAPPKGGVVQEF